MGAREPVWWYGGGSRWLSALLAPAGWCYGALTARRMHRSPSHRAGIPVICVGNFTAGGTGKTPVVALLIDVLRTLGHRPVVLSRGYGGTTTGPHLVDIARDIAADVGDEPLLLAALAPVMVARDRAAGARAIEAAAHVRATVILMDDGIQNPALAKDLTIAVVDAARGFGNGRCIPSGPLRAPLAAQLPCVDALVLNLGNGDRPQSPSVAALCTTFTGVVASAGIAPLGDLGWLRGVRVVAYAGIGAPERFFATVAAQGAVLRQQVPFGDHHAFTPADAERLLDLANAEGATLVTTEKDRARLLGATGPLGALSDASRTLPIRLQPDPPGLAALERLIASRAPLKA